MIIGITGRSGSGKSYLSEILAQELDMIHVDIDKISHEVLSFPETKKFLIAEFGNSIFENGVLNRKTLGKLAFNNKEKMQKLNDFCQTQIEKRLDEIKNSTKKTLIFDYALLWKLKQFDDCDIKIYLETDFETRYSRVSARENITKDYFIARENSLEEVKNLKFDYILKNATNKQIKNLVNSLKQKIKEQLWLEKQQSSPADLVI